MAGRPQDVRVGFVLSLYYFLGFDLFPHRFHCGSGGGGAGGVECDGKGLKKYQMNYFWCMDLAS